MIERDVVRVAVQDASGAVLLFRARDSTQPDVPDWWELPGGGLDAGEVHVAAAVRELREETGFRVEPADVGPPLWRRTATFVYRGARRLQHEVVVLVRVAGRAPVPGTARRLDYELADYPGHRWFQPHELAASPERCYPGRLREFLPMLLNDEAIDEPFEHWS